jgi:hypothetical protein
MLEETVLVAEAFTAFETVERLDTEVVRADMPFENVEGP